MKNNFVILLVGKTHTGKSTFARKLADQIEDTMVLETDPITAFLNNNWPKLQKDENLDPYAGKRLSTLRLRIFLELIRTALSQSKNIILANANLQKFTRDEFINLSKEFSSYKTITVFINLPDEVIKKRIESAKKEKNVLLFSKDFNDVLVRQNKVIAPPESTETDYLFEIKDENEIDNIILKLKEVVNNEKK